MKNTYFSLDYVNENEFRKLERSLRKYNMLAYKKLSFTYYPELRKGNFIGEMISQNKKNGSMTYELKLPSDSTFAHIYGEVKLKYIVYQNEKTILLETITPEEILIKGHKEELTAYKGIMIDKENAAKEKFKIDLLNALQDK